MVPLPYFCEDLYLDLARCMRHLNRHCYVCKGNLENEPAPWNLSFLPEELESKFFSLMREIMVLAQKIRILVLLSMIQDECSWKFEGNERRNDLKRKSWTLDCLRHLVPLDKTQLWMPRAESILQEMLVALGYKVIPFWNSGIEQWHIISISMVEKS